MATPAQATGDVAREIIALIRQPEAERYTNPALHDIVRRYYNDVGAFEGGKKPG